jgi:hypothetical protein
MTKAWTRPYCGVSHLGDLRDLRRATVATYGDMTTLTLWCRATKPTQRYFHGANSLKMAQGAGEDWVAGRLLGSEALTGMVDELRRLKIEGLLEGSNVLDGLARLLAEFEQSASEPGT